MENKTTIKITCSYGNATVVIPKVVAWQSRPDNEGKFSEWQLEIILENTEPIHFWYKHDDVEVMQSEVLRLKQKVEKYYERK